MRCHQTSPAAPSVWLSTAADSPNKTRPTCSELTLGKARMRALSKSGDTKHSIGGAVGVGETAGVGVGLRVRVAVGIGVAFNVTVGPIVVVTEGSKVGVVS